MRLAWGLVGLALVGGFPGEICAGDLGYFRDDAHPFEISTELWRKLEAADLEPCFPPQEYHCYGGEGNWKFCQACLGSRFLLWEPPKARIYNQARPEIP